MIGDLNLGKAVLERAWERYRWALEFFNGEYQKYNEGKANSKDFADGALNEAVQNLDFITDFLIQMYGMAGVTAAKEVEEKWNERLK